MTEWQLPLGSSWSQTVVIARNGQPSVYYLFTLNMWDSNFDFDFCPNEAACTRCKSVPEMRCIAGVLGNEQRNKQSFDKSFMPLLSHLSLSALFFLSLSEPSKCLSVPTVFVVFFHWAPVLSRVVWLNYRRQNALRKIQTRMSVHLLLCVCLVRAHGKITPLPYQKTFLNARILR